MRAAEPLACRFCRFTRPEGPPGSRCPNDGSALLRRSVLESWAHDPVLGRVVAGRFPVIDVIGRGGTGTVYLALHEPIERPVALKVLSGQTDPELRARFERETRVLARLQHPSHVPVIDCGAEGDGLLYIVLEYVHGRPLRQILKELGPMTPRRVVDVALQILGVLAEAHALGLVHRDIRPSNIMLSRGALGEDQAHLLDFGFARIVHGERHGFGDGGDGGSSRTRRGLVRGTPLYMSPEQATGRNVGPASDLYSLGVVVYKMLSGRTPFSGEDPVAILAAHRRAPPPPLPASTGAPKLLRDVVDRALAKRPEHRFQSAVEMAEALRNALSRNMTWASSPAGSSSENMPPVPLEELGLETDLPDADPSETEAEPLGPDSVLDESESPISLVLDIIDEPDADDASAGLTMVAAQPAEPAPEEAPATGPVIIPLAAFDPVPKGGSIIVPLDEFRPVHDDEVLAEQREDSETPVDDGFSASAPTDSDHQVPVLTIQDFAIEEEGPLTLEEAEAEMIDRPLPPSRAGTELVPLPDSGESIPPASMSGTTIETPAPVALEPPESSRPTTQKVGRGSSTVLRAALAAVLIAAVAGVVVFIGRDRPRTVRTVEVGRTDRPPLVASARSAVPVTEEVPEVEAIPAPPDPLPVHVATRPPGPPGITASRPAPASQAAVSPRPTNRAVVQPIGRPAPVATASSGPQAKPLVPNAPSAATPRPPVPARPPATASAPARPATPPPMPEF